MKTQKLPSVTVAIPTYKREEVLLSTLRQLLALDYSAHEILVMDQTENHQKQTEKELASLDKKGLIRWCKLSEPSITKAMNFALIEATSEIVLFVDDDVDVTSPLIREHASEYLEENVKAVAGQVIQSWEHALDEDESAFIPGHENDPDCFMFNSAKRVFVKRFIGCNVSMRRDSALSVGGFDENFVKVAYRFEAEFADRFVGSANPIVFQPKASVRHLKVLEGGTRSYGDHLRTIRPSHSVGRYYYLLVALDVHQRIFKIVSSPISSVLTRFHLSHPWWIPLTFFAEIQGLLWALWLRLKGRRLLKIGWNK